MSGPNTSHAVMAQRIEPADSLDDFPTPPWAVRAFCEFMGFERLPLFSTVWEPAANRGFMAKTLAEYFSPVVASDVHDYGVGFDVLNFVEEETKFNPDWVITNPPFRLALEFVQKGLDVAEKGVAVLVRTSWLESKRRYEALFRDTPPTKIIYYVERVPMVKGRYDPDASTATAYCWCVWEKDAVEQPPTCHWIEPCKARLYREGDELL